MGEKKATYKITEGQVVALRNFFSEGKTYRTSVPARGNRIGRRTYVKQLLNRQSAYRLSDYVRKLRKDRDIIDSISSIWTCLKHMADSGQIAFEIVDGKVYGFTL